ncbi:MULTISPECIES: ABC transporter ATP-binding protein [unclassified Paenibacillus]|uniref:ABC transporter ATP-binding protein n=1 Tax=unclassified Paenibacillus TaxID=185978 RepID=UPI001AE9B6F0|nr:MULTISPECIES: ABC transporter ATP-binding protein [unclassified Paenibacillus]MBP1157408.1 ATP-binding cassette subfamily B protein [Paenibacillus sp. PvP091]MBP1171854.1 ATP-binding cassette subfamily B protein [Paenibacillus sp. PvR098]MBP2438235.1 ATP-binding cassette subfamily B protein [Paenibacillus sp. PvP052]
MRNVMSFLKPYRIAIIIALFLMLVELMVELLHPLLMAKIINEGIMKKELSVVLRWGGIMVGISLLGFASGIINSFFAAHVSQSFGLDIRKSLFAKVQSFSYARFHQFATSTLITRVTSDVTQLQNIVFAGLRIMMRAPLFMILGMVMALTVHFQLAFILVVVIPLLLVFMAVMMKKGFTLFRSVQERLDHANGIVRENLMGIRLIKAFVRDGHEMKRFSNANEDLMDRTASALRLIELTIPMLLLVMNSSILFILWYGSLEVNANHANLGEIVAIVNYATRITGSFSVVSMIMMILSRGKASANRISEVLAAKVDEKDSGPRESAHRVTEGKLVFKEVSFQYPGTSEPVLKSVSFTAQPGETVAILGATGSGKTSLFQLIPRLYEASGGTLLIDGTDIRTMKPEELREEIGLVPQEAILFTGTIRDNILWGKEDASMEQVIQAAQAAQIHETIMKLSHQYETVVGQKGVNLSGGQKQRLSIARALIRKPKLLLLDDSTSALDLNTEARLLAALSTFPCTRLIITQKIGTAMRADQILLLDDGRLLAAGKHEALMRQSELYRQIVRSQFIEEDTAHV